MKKNKNKKRITGFVLTAFLVSIFLTLSVFATDGPPALGAARTQLAQTFEALYNMVLTISVPVAAIGIAYCGLMIIVGSTADVSKIVQLLKAVITTLVSELMIKLVIYAAKMVATSTGFVYHPGAQVLTVVLSVTDIAML